MPKRIAETDAFKQIEEHIGSGPFKFDKAEFKPGDSAVYLKNDEVRAAQRGAIGHDRRQTRLRRSGRVEPRASRCAGAGQRAAEGRGRHHRGARLRLPRHREEGPESADARSAAVFKLQYMARFNHLHKPFDNPKVRQAAMAAFRQEPFLRAQVGVKELYSSCPSMFICGTPFGSSAGCDIQAKSNMKKAQELLKASGYDGTPIVLMKPTDLASDPEAARTSPPNCCARPASRSICRPWTGRPWWVDARRRTRPLRAAGTCS